MRAVWECQRNTDTTAVHDLSPHDAHIAPPPKWTSNPTHLWHSSNNQHQRAHFSWTAAQEKRDRITHHRPWHLTLTPQQDDRADVPKHDTPAMTSSRVPNTIDVETDAEGVTRGCLHGKEETGNFTAPDSHDPLLPESEISPTAPTTNPKRNKKLKTYRQAPYQQGRTRSKTRGSKPHYTTMSAWSLYIR